MSFCLNSILPMTHQSYHVLFRCLNYRSAESDNFALSQDLWWKHRVQNKFSVLSRWIKSYFIFMNIERENLILFWHIYINTDFCESTYFILVIQVRDEFLFSVLRNQLYVIGWVFKVKINFFFLFWIILIVLLFLKVVKIQVLSYPEETFCQVCDKKCNIAAVVFWLEYPGWRNLSSGLELNVCQFYP